MDDDRIRLSIITVVKDDPGGLQRTVASVRSQQGHAIEHLVVDSSVDADEVRAQVLDDQHPGAHVVWTPPMGIYPAMNLGLGEARGDYALFLNAGDTLVAGALDAVLEAVSTDPLWGYGQVAFVDARGTRTLPPPIDFARERRVAFARGRFPPHQGTFARRDTLITLGGFDTSYRIAADYALMLTLARAADPIERAETIAEFPVGGASTKHWLTAIAEFHRARVDVWGLRPAQRPGELVRTAAGAGRMAAARAAYAMRGATR